MQWKMLQGVWVRAGRSVQVVGDECGSQNHELIDFFFFNFYFVWKYSCFRLPWFSESKEPSCQCRKHRRRGFRPWVGKIPWRRKWHPTLVGEALGQRSLAGYSPWDHEESATTERLTLSLSQLFYSAYSKVIHTCIFFFRFFSHIGYYRVLGKVLMRFLDQDRQQTWPQPHVESLWVIRNDLTVEMNSASISRCTSKG